MNPWLARLREPLGRYADGEVTARILAAALAAVEPEAAVRRRVERQAGVLRLGEHRIELPPGGRVWCIAVGKAAAPMARALATSLGSALAGGVVVVKHPRPEVPPGLARIVGAHPVPDARSETAGRAVMECLSKTKPDDLVVVALSGGASSLMVAPAPGLEVGDLAALGQALLHRGAPIDELNAVRGALDRLKAGGLRRLARPARVATLLLVDVVGAPLSVVGSGPTLGRPRPSVAREVLQRRGVVPSPAVQTWLDRQPDEDDGTSTDEPFVVVADNETAVHAALAEARVQGWDTVRLPALTGEARDAGRELAGTLARLRPERPTVLVAGGETTVTVRGQGRGGRNQELALAAIPGLRGSSGCLLVTLATDGEDGPTDAAGAIVDGDSAARAEARGLDVAARLADNDAHSVFEALGDRLRIGPTGTNVCDLVLALVRP